VPASLLDLHTDEMFTLCASPAIIAELTRILADRFEWTQEDIEATLTPIFSRADTVDSKIAVTASPDPDDNYILERALESKSDVIVTGDQAVRPRHMPREEIIEVRLRISLLVVPWFG
jgi:putative PIN family toxin of toxin-antitoxin system